MPRNRRGYGRGTAPPTTPAQTATPTSPAPTGQRTRRWPWSKILGWIVGVLVVGTIGWYGFTTVSAKPTPVINQILTVGEDYKDIRRVTIGPGNPLIVDVKPGERLDWWGDVEPSVARKGSTIVTTLSAKGEADVEIDYRLYICTSLTPCDP